MASSSVPVHSPLGNRLLAMLSPETYSCLDPHLEIVDLPLGTVLYEPGASLGYGYFPIRCIFSILNVLESGACAETAIVGNEGMLGVALFMGGGASPDRAVVYSKGQAFRLASPLIKQEFSHNVEFRTLMLRYTQSLIMQTAQTAVCNRHHTIDQQLCRRLLLTMDRTGSNELNLTQELIAHSIGVRREGITEAAKRLQNFGVIDYKRGRIVISDRSKLESLCCECYEAVREESNRLFSNANSRLRARNIWGRAEHAS